MPTTLLPSIKEDLERGNALIAFVGHHDQSGNDFMEIEKEGAAHICEAVLANPEVLRKCREMVTKAYEGYAEYRDAPHETHVAVISELATYAQSVAEDYLGIAMIMPGYRHFLQLTLKQVNWRRVGNIIRRRFVTEIYKLQD